MAEVQVPIAVARLMHELASLGEKLPAQAELVLRDMTYADNGGEPVELVRVRGVRPSLMQQAGADRHTIPRPPKITVVSRPEHDDPESSRSPDAPTLRDGGAIPSVKSRGYFASPTTGDEIPSHTPTEETP